MKSVFPVLLAALLGSACSERPKEDFLAQDSSLASDLALANQDTAALPQLADVPAAVQPGVSEPAPAPPPARVQAPARTVVRRPAPAPAPAPAPVSSAPTTRVTQSGNTETIDPRGSERALGVVSAGSEIALASGQRVCTNTSKVGDRFSAQIANPVMGANGAVIPVGATALVTISSLKTSEGSGDNIEIGLTVESITFDGRTYPVTSRTTYAEVDRVRAESRSDDVKKVAAGAAIGAVLGQVFGGRTKSTVIGAATGAAAGAVVANRTADYNGCVPSGGRITITLSEPLTIQRT
ncbi:MAG: YMGG-like glycine zipper-containing protein [Gemmatimonadaceae bacterium]